MLRGNDSTRAGTPAPHQHHKHESTTTTPLLIKVHYVRVTDRLDAARTQGTPALHIHLAWWEFVVSGVVVLSQWLECA